MKTDGNLHHLPPVILIKRRNPGARGLSADRERLIFIFTMVLLGTMCELNVTHTFICSDFQYLGPGSVSFFVCAPGIISSNFSISFEIPYR